MIEIAGIWEQGWNVPITECTEWEMMLREFGVESLNMVPVSGIAAPWGDKPWLSEYHKMDEVLAEKSGLTPVFVTEQGTTELKDFVHPDNALYVFGRASQNVKAPEGAVTLKISTPNPGCLWAHQACAIVLYDRFSKQ